MEAEKEAFEAVKQGDLATLEALAREEASRGKNILDAVGEHQRTLLHVAASKGHEHIIKWLLSDEGGRALGFTNVLAIDFLGFVVLHLAASRGYLACCRAIVEGCKVENGEREEMLNTMTEPGSTLLRVAAAYQGDRILRWLLSNEEGGGRSLGLKSETITALDNYSQSALHQAVFGGYRSSVEALLSGCTAGERIKLFLAVSKQRGWTLLHQAARSSNAEAIVELLCHEEAKMIVNHRDHRGMTVLHRTVCKGGLDKESRDEWSMRPFPLSQDEPIVRALLGLDPSTTAVAAFVDVNAGLEIPEDIKIAAAAAEEAKKRAASKKHRKIK